MSFYYLYFDPLWGNFRKNRMVKAKLKFKMDHSHINR